MAPTSPLGEVPFKRGQSWLGENFFPSDRSISPSVDEFDRRDSDGNMTAAFAENPRYLNTASTTSKRPKLTHHRLSCEQSFESPKDRLLPPDPSSLLPNENIQVVYLHHPPASTAMCKMSESHDSLFPDTSRRPNDAPAAATISAPRPSICGTTTPSGCDGVAPPSSWGRVISFTAQPPLVLLCRREPLQTGFLPPAHMGCLVQLETKSAPSGTDADSSSMSSEAMQEFLLHSLEQHHQHDPADTPSSKSSMYQLYEDVLADWMNHPVDTKENIEQALQSYQQRPGHDDDVGEMGHCDTNETSHCQQEEEEPSPSSPGRRYVGDEELLWWRHGTGRPSLRNLAKLRRFLYPMAVLLLPAMRCDPDDQPGNECVTRDSSRPAAPVMIRIGLSMADFLIRCPTTRSSTLDILHRQAQILRVWTTTSTWTGNCCRTEVRYHYERLLHRLVHTLRRSNEPRFRALRLADLPLPQYSPSTTKCSHQAPTPIQSRGSNRRSYPVNRTLELLDFKVERKRLWEEADGLGQVGSAAQKKPDFLLAGNVLLTEQEDEWTERDFLIETHFMKKLSPTLPRAFHPWASRPRLAGLRVPLPAGTEAGTCSLDNAATMQLRQQLKALFFDAAGRLKRSCVPDVSTSSKHHYIYFANRAGAGSSDYRWQIPLKLHPLVNMTPGQPPKLVATRARVEDLLRQTGVINEDYESIHDCAILVGGTEDQSLHHDISRQWTFWLPRRSVRDRMEPTLGWEANRLAYNRAMASPFAPSSILIGMGEGNHILVGVQKDQIERIGDGTRCSIAGGRPYETFDVVRETTHLVVLQVPTGCIFTGDFPHAGVRNVAPGSPDDQLLQQLNTKIMSIVESNGDADHATVIKAITEMFCNFEGLDRLCRFHCSTELRQKIMEIPRNQVGYASCLDNPPNR